MKRIEYFKLIADLFHFKTVVDELKNEYVLFSNNEMNAVHNISDKTEFEAFQNHVHLLDNVKNEEFDALISLADSLGRSLLYNLKYHYPEKHFIVFVSISLNDSFIIRFHQKWENEEPYCNVDDFTSPNERVFAFEA